MKSRFLERYYESRKRPLSHAVLSRFEQLAALATTTPRLAGMGTGPAGRDVGLVDLPAPKPFERRSLPMFDSDGPSVDVVIMPDVFTGKLERETLHRAIDALTAVGYSVAVAPFVGSGKFDHVKGRRAAFAKATAAQGAMIASIVASGARPAVIEPAIALLHDAEYRHIDANHPGSAVQHLATLLDERLDRIPRSATPQTVNLLAHCTERSTAPAVVAAWRRILEAAGHTVAVPAIGCCGMAGIFGHEKSNQETSRALWDLTWAEVAADPDAVAVATGYSCRSQAGRFGATPIDHPLSLL